MAIFEKRAERASTGGRGRIDLFWPGVVAVEHKSAGKDLAAAEQQCLDYLEGLPQAELPTAIVSSDFARIRILDLTSGEPAVEFSTKDLAKEIERFGFIAGYGTKRMGVKESEVDAHAAELMGLLYNEIAAIGLTDHEASVFLTRMLFLFFGDDTGLWERNLFLEFVETRTHVDGSDLGAQLSLLFQTLDRPVANRAPTLDETLLRFPYVNGGLFADRMDIPSFNATIRQQLVECCLVDWAAIVPAIFGSMFQAVKSKEDRRALGEHYTSEANILKVIGPLFLDDLYAQFDAAFHDVKKLQRLRDSLESMKFLDPACGCGNFLAIAYREMRDFELKVMTRLAELTGQSQLSLDSTLGLKVSLSQFYGIELEEWPARIAEVALFLVDHQANLRLAEEFGQAPDRLPITSNAKIVQANALTTDWAEVVGGFDQSSFIMGNPPFAGRTTRTKQMTDELQQSFDGAKGSGNIDFVCAWFAKAGKFISRTPARAAFVSTNSIVQGEQPATLWGYLKALNIGIDFAWEPFVWRNAARGQAAVHCVIVGFSDHAVRKVAGATLYRSGEFEGEEVATPSITRYLTPGSDIEVISRRQPISAGVPLMRFGSMPHDGGHLLLSPEAREEILSQDPEAAEFIRPLVGSAELIRGVDRYCIWVRDEDTMRAAKIPSLRRRAELVQEERLKSPDQSAVAAATRPLTFKARRQPTSRYLAVPSVSSAARSIVPIAAQEPETIASNLVLTVADDAPWIFGVLSSVAFNAWNRTVSGRMKSDTRISAEITYNNFPWPTLDDPGKEAITAAAQAVLDARAAHPGASLADLYDPLAMPADLTAAHRRLDQAVLAAYGLPKDADDAAILTHLFDLYTQLTTADQLDLDAGKKPVKKRTPRKKAAGG